MKNIQDAYIVAATRSAVGRSGRGALKNTRPDDLLGNALQHILTQVPTLDPKAIEAFGLLVLSSLSVTLELAAVAFSIEATFKTISSNGIISLFQFLFTVAILNPVISCILFWVGISFN